MQKTDAPASVNPPEPYIRAELEIIRFEESVITTSNCFEDWVGPPHLSA